MKTACLPVKYQMPLPGAKENHMPTFSPVPPVPHADEPHLWMTSIHWLEPA